MRVRIVSVTVILITVGLFTRAAVAQEAETPKASSNPAISWVNILKQKPDWYRSDDALRIADNVLLFQRESGGWPKNIEMAARLTEAAAADIASRKKEQDSTIDNGATFTQLEFLARVYTARATERHKESFLKGLDYLLRAQYPNGGWPQYYPKLEGYYKHITFNDNAMVGVLKLLRAISEKRPDYAFVDESLRTRAAKAVEKGIDCILKTQVVINGKRTVWCAQHDEVTLAPAPARKFEPVSLSGYESVGVVRFLMGADHPDARVIEAIESAVSWFKSTRLSGIRWVEKPDPSMPKGYDRVVVKDSAAPALWARFYELGTDRPIFIGRDSKIKYAVADIEEERRNGYSWYVEEPSRLLDRDYPAWLRKIQRVTQHTH